MRPSWGYQLPSWSDFLNLRGQQGSLYSEFLFSHPVLEMGAVGPEQISYFTVLRDPAIHRVPEWGSKDECCCLSIFQAHCGYSLLSELGSPNCQTHSWVMRETGISPGTAHISLASWTRISLLKARACFCSHERRDIRAITTEKVLLVRSLEF